MLSAVLKSPTAISVSIVIMNAFVEARRLLTQNHEHEVAINDLKQRMKNELKNIYKVLGALSARSQKPLPPIGFEAIEAQRKEKGDIGK